MLSIKKIEKKKTNLNIEWSDGEKSNFNYFWLRDNCPTAHDKDSNHRMFNILETSKDLIAEESKVNEEGKLVVKWSEGNHTSYYDQKWLRENCYTLKNKQKFITYKRKSRIEEWENFTAKDTKQLLYRLRAFGRESVALQNVRKKIDYRGKSCIYLGLSRYNSKAYVLYSSISNTIFTSRNIITNEMIFPFSKNNKSTSR